MQIIRILSILILSSWMIGCADEEENGPYDLSKIANQQPLGSSANDLLNDQTYTRLTIEMVSVEGHELSATALIEFKNFLEKHLQKPDGITVQQRTVASSGLASFAIDEIAMLEEKHRSRFTEGDELTVYIYVADGSSIKDQGQKVTLGTAYLNTSMVIYGETLHALSKHNDAPRLSTIEATTLNHEFSHLLGLVNTDISSPSTEANHESVGHCDVKGCLMEAAIEFKSGMMDVLGKGIPELDATCLAKLKAIKSLNKPSLLQQT